MIRNVPVEREAALFHNNATTIDDTLHLLMLPFGRNACFGMEIRNSLRELPGPPSCIRERDAVFRHTPWF